MLDMNKLSENESKMSATQYKPRGTTGLFDAHEIREKLQALGNPLHALDRQTDFELFRPELENAMLNTKKKSPAGQKPYDAVMMFKIMIIKVFYALSDDQAEYQINDRESFKAFLGLAGGDRVPDAKTIWRFGDRLAETGLDSRLFDRFNAFLDDRGLIAKTGVIVDASFAEVPRQRNSRDENAAIKEGRGDELWHDNPRKKAQKDTDARWTKKNGITFFGYKNHVKIDAASKLVTRYSVTPAAVHDSQAPGAIVTADDAPQPLYADSACSGQAIGDALAAKQVGNRVHGKGYKNRPLTAQQQASNRAKSRIRVRVEHVFGFMTQSMRTMFSRLIGLRRNASHIGLMNLVYNLFRYEQIRRLNLLPAAVPPGEAMP